MRNWAVTIRARAHLAAGFSKCCMLSGEFDGSDRDYFFQNLSGVRQKDGRNRARLFLTPAANGG